MIGNNQTFILIIIVTCKMYTQTNMFTLASDCIILEINQVIGTFTPLSICEEIR